MKKVYYILQFVFAFICCSACQELTKPEDDNPDSIVVHLGMTDDLQTRASATNNLYGINNNTSAAGYTVNTIIINYKFIPFLFGKIHVN